MFNYEDFYYSITFMIKQRRCPQLEIKKINYITFIHGKFCSY